MTSMSPSTSAPNLRVLVVDDEPLARERLADLVAANAEPRCEVVAQCANALQAQDWLELKPVDAVLLDIQMPGTNGLDLAARWRRLPRPPVVVFVTAHSEHAVTAFDLEAADYLTKPVRRDRLAEALQRAARRVAAAPVATPDGAPPVLVVSERGRVIRVPLAEVLYLKAELKYVTLRTAAHSYVLDDALTDLEQRLGERFLRVHRNALVARSAVRSLERRRVEGDDDGHEPGELGWAVCVGPVNEWLAVSRRQVTAVREALQAR
jgi:two-component system, LytTR family, response regulator AlgR